MKALLLSLCAIFLISTTTLFAKEEAKIYQTYLVNDSSHFAEYVIENEDLGVKMYSGILPPRWAVKNKMKGWDDLYKVSGQLPWVLVVEIHEDLLGKYRIHLRFLYTREGATTDGRWRSMETNLSRSDFEREDHMFPYWEINDDPAREDKLPSMHEDIDGKCTKKECGGICKKSFNVPVEKAEKFMYFMSLKEIRIMSDEYSEYMDLVYWMLYNGYEDAGEHLRKHIGKMKLLP